MHFTNRLKSEIYLLLGLCHIVLLPINNCSYSSVSLGFRCNTARHRLIDLCLFLFHVKVIFQFNPLIISVKKPSGPKISFSSSLNCFLKARRKQTDHISGKMFVITTEEGNGLERWDQNTVALH